MGHEQSAVYPQARVMMSTLPLSFSPYLAFSFCPSHVPIVGTWQTLVCLATEDLYLVLDLVEFASILVGSEGLVEGAGKVTQSPVPLLMYQDDGTG